MDIKITSAKLNGNVRVCTSKSEAHRLIICSLLSFGKTKIMCSDVSVDIAATIDCIRALGAKADITDEYILVNSSDGINSAAVLNCKESGSTLRFFIPVACALGVETEFCGEGRLPERTNAPLIKELSKKNCRFDREDGLPLNVTGKLSGGTYEIPGNISSQYISGLLFALPILESDSVIKIIGKIESKPYIDLTIKALETFGIKIDFDIDKGVINISGNQKYKTPGVVNVNGDWSNGAFWLSLGAIDGNSVVCDNLDRKNLQGDAKIVELIARLKGAESGDSVTINAKQIPDLVPVISVVAASRIGTTVICGAERLRIKESNRIESTVAMITSLGGTAFETDDGLYIDGSGVLTGGTVETYNDHRIAMSAAVAASICKNDVIIKNAQCVNKSYPAFFDVYESIGGVLERS